MCHKQTKKGNKLSYYYDIETLRKDTKAFMLNYGMTLSDLAVNTEVPATSLTKFFNGKGLNIESAFKIMNYIRFEPDIVTHVPLPKKKKHFGQELARLRKEKGKTQQEVGDAIGCTRAYICYVEKQKNCKLSLTHALAITEFLGIDPKELS